MSTTENTDIRGTIGSGGSNRAKAATKENVDRLNEILQAVLDVFNYEKEEIENKISTFMWVAIGIAMILLVVYFLIIGDIEYFMPDFKNNPTLKSWYEIGIRIGFISLMVSVIIYCLKMLKVYLSLLSQVRHKIATNKSMPTLVYGIEDDILFKTIYIKITDMVIQLYKVEDKDIDFNIGANSLSDILKNISKAG